jgi:hypothetical protein
VERAIPASTSAPPRMRSAAPETLETSPETRAADAPDWAGILAGPAAPAPSTRWSVKERLLSSVTGRQL